MKLEVLLCSALLLGWSGSVVGQPVPTGTGAVVLPFTPAGRTNEQKSKNAREYVAKMDQLVGCVVADSTPSVEPKMLYNRCRMLCAGDPRLELVYGLTYVKAGDVRSALRRFEMAAASPHLFLPAAHEALIYYAALSDDLPRMSAALEAYGQRLSNGADAWPPEQARIQGARWSGRMMGLHLKGPVLIRKDAEHQRVLQANEVLQETFPPILLEEFQEGRATVLSEYEQHLSASLSLAPPWKHYLDSQQALENSRQDAAAQFLDVINVKSQHVALLAQKYQQEDAAIEQIKQELSRNRAAVQLDKSGNSDLARAFTERAQEAIRERWAAQDLLKQEKARIDAEVSRMRSEYQVLAKAAAQSESAMRTTNQRLAESSQTEQADFRKVDAYMKFSITDQARAIRLSLPSK